MMSQLGLVGGLDHFLFFKANVFICEGAFQGEGGYSEQRLRVKHFVYFLYIAFDFYFVVGRA